MKLSKGTECIVRARGLIVSISLVGTLFFLTSCGKTNTGSNFNPVSEDKNPDKKVSQTVNVKKSEEKKEESPKEIDHNTPEDYANLNKIQPKASQLTLVSYGDFQFYQSTGISNIGIYKTLNELPHLQPFEKLSDSEYSNLGYKTSLFMPVCFKNWSYKYIGMKRDASSVEITIDMYNTGDSPLIIDSSKIKFVFKNDNVQSRIENEPIIINKNEIKTIKISAKNSVGSLIFNNITPDVSTFILVSPDFKERESELNEKDTSPLVRSYVAERDIFYFRGGVCGNGKIKGLAYFFKPLDATEAFGMKFKKGEFFAGDIAIQNTSEGDLKILGLKFCGSTAGKSIDYKEISIDDIEKVFGKSTIKKVISTGETCEGYFPLINLGENDVSGAILIETNKGNFYVASGNVSKLLLN